VFYGAGRLGWMRRQWPSLALDTLMALVADRRMPA